MYDHHINQYDLDSVSSLYSPSAELDRITFAEEMARFARNYLIAARFTLKSQHHHVFVRFSVRNTSMIVIQIKNKKHVIQVLL